MTARFYLLTVAFVLAWAGANAAAPEKASAPVCPKIGSPSSSTADNPATQDEAGDICRARLAAAEENFALAEFYYRQAFDVEKRRSGENAPSLGEIESEIALQESNQGHFRTARTSFADATIRINASADEGLRARLESYLALDAENRGKVTDALCYASRATALRRQALHKSAANEPRDTVDPRQCLGAQTAGTQTTGRAEASEDESYDPLFVSAERGDLAHSLRLEAELALRSGNISHARASAEEALAIVYDDQNLPLWWRPEITSLMARVNEAAGRVLEAERNFVDTARLDEKLFGNTTPTALARLDLAEFYVRRDVPADAMKQFDLAFGEAAGDALTRSFIRADDIVPLIDAELALPEQNQAGLEKLFGYAQLSEVSPFERSVGRFAFRAGRGAQPLETLNQASLAADRARAELAAEYAKPDKDRDLKLEPSLAEDAQHLAGEAVDYRKALSDQDSSHLLNPPAANLAQVQSKLLPGQALVQFVIGRNGGYALVTRHDGFVPVPLKFDYAILQSEIAELREAISPADGRPGDFKLSTASKLYSSLVQPLDAQLSGVRDLIVVPGQTLLDFPMAVLVSTPPRAEHDYENAAWLVRRFALSETPSAYAFVTLHDQADARDQSAAGRPLKFLGIAMADAAQRKGRNQKDALVAVVGACGETDLPALRETGQEVDAAAKNYASTILAPHPTKAEFLKEPLSEFRIIYFATHGVLPGETQCGDDEPGLVLASTANASDPAASLLKASEIAQLHLANTDLVVLSACNTAIEAAGTEQDNSTMSDNGSLEALSDSFFDAGARTVLASRWAIDSASASALMKDTFRALKPGVSVSEALKQAENDMIDGRLGGSGRESSKARPSAWSHPFYWAPFAVMGDPAGLPGSQ
jgi:CHAT domain-containing protein